MESFVIEISEFTLKRYDRDFSLYRKLDPSTMRIFAPRSHGHEFPFVETFRRIIQFSRTQ
ncbi:hypothetical protein V1478_012645 [Vespula squamosa]|uniref:Maturase K n=1 Tax=Vespula squamosa TaxID=30214 RepID=A0ABD2AB72_VESSQ